MSVKDQNSILFVLTEDLLVKIYEKLESSRDKKSFRATCREFHRLDSVTRSSLRVLRVEFLIPLLTTTYRNITSLDLSVCPRVDDGTVSLALSDMSRDTWTKRLRSLNLSRATGLRHRGVEALARECTRVESVDVSYCVGFGDREAAGLTWMREVREVRLDKCLKVGDVGLVNLAVGFGSKLEMISLKWCLGVSDLGVDLLCVKCKELKSLDLSYLKVTDNSIRSISTLLKLEVLAIVGCPLITDAGLQFLENGCPLLKEIDVSRCDRVTLSGLLSIIRGHSGLVQINAGHCILEFSPGLLHCMKDLKNLTKLVIGGAHITDTAFKTISNNCMFLTEIGLSKCRWVTDMGIRLLLSGCSKLKIIDLTCCLFISDSSIDAISDSCRELVCLKLESCNKITSGGLSNLGMYCQFLEELDLTDCSGIFDEGLKSLSRCSTLTSLKLGFCTNISDRGLICIASECSKLRELDLYHCSGIGDDGLAGLANGCKKLKKLNISYCRNVTDLGMKFLGCLQELLDLEVRGLDKLTSFGLAALAAGCKQLSDLDLKHCTSIDDLGFYALAYCALNLRQLNVSHCAISDMALCMVMGNLTRLQDAKLTQLKNITVGGFELALRACSVRIKKVKLAAALRVMLSTEILEILHTRGCVIRWD